MSIIFLYLKNRMKNAPSRVALTLAAITSAATAVAANNAPISNEITPYPEEGTPNSCLVPFAPGVDALSLEERTKFSSWSFSYRNPFGDETNPVGLFNKKNSVAALKALKSADLKPACDIGIQFTVPGESYSQDRFTLHGQIVACLGDSMNDPLLNCTLAKDEKGNDILFEIKFKPNSKKIGGWQVPQPFTSTMDIDTTFPFLDSIEGVVPSGMIVTVQPDETPANVESINAIGTIECGPTKQP